MRRPAHAFPQVRGVCGRRALVAGALDPAGLQQLVNHAVAADIEDPAALTMGDAGWAVPRVVDPHPLAVTSHRDRVPIVPAVRLLLGVGDARRHQAHGGRGARPVRRGGAERGALPRPVRGRVAAATLAVDGPLLLALGRVAQDGADDLDADAGGVRVGVCGEGESPCDQPAELVVLEADGSGQRLAVQGTKRPGWAKSAPPSDVRTERSIREGAAGEAEEAGAAGEVGEAGAAGDAAAAAAGGGVEVGRRSDAMSIRQGVQREEREQRRRGRPAC